jgi:hypothetical protein
MQADSGEIKAVGWSGFCCEEMPGEWITFRLVNWVNIY